MIKGIDGDIRVVKLGGSLLDLADLAGVLRRWLSRQPAAFNVVLVGGGRLANAVRNYDRLHRLSDSDAHWLAIRAMELNGRLLAALLPEAVWLDSLPRAADGLPRAADGLPHAADGLQRAADAEGRLAILDPYRFLREDERSPSPLPAGWGVTSDSIAARAAERSGAVELALLKSALPPGPNLAGAMAAGYIDAAFPAASRRVPRIRCVNLREQTFPEAVCVK